MRITRVALVGLGMLLAQQAAYAHHGAPHTINDGVLTSLGMGLMMLGILLSLVVVAFDKGSSGPGRRKLLLTKAGRSQESTAVLAKVEAAR